MDLSIIIPVYNTNIESFKRCLFSIMNLKGLKYEVIIVDDGSDKLNSNEYIKLIQNINRDEIKYYFQENSGVSTARNIGVGKSSGKYVMFIDSDDKIDASKINIRDLNDSYDIIVYNLVIVGRKKNMIVKPIDREAGIIDSNFVLKSLVTKCKFYSPCAKLIKREMIEINKIEFNPNIIHGEDAIFNLDMLKVTPVIYYTNKNLYLYEYTFDTSSSRWKNNTVKMINSIVKLHNEKVQLKSKLGLTMTDLLTIYEDTIKKCFIGCMEICTCNDKTEKFRCIIDKLKCLNIDVSGLSVLSKIKYKIIIKKKISIISLLSIIRKFHLKLK